MIEYLPIVRRSFIQNMLLLVSICWQTPSLATGAGLEPYSGENVRDFSLTDLSGHTHALSNYKDKVVLINFWASWCIPCLQEMPGMQRLQASLKDENFTLLTINISDPPRQIRETLKRLQLDLTVLLDRDGGTFKQWGGQVLPTSFILDQDSLIRYHAIGPIDWDDPDVVRLIKKLLTD